MKELRFSKQPSTCFSNKLCNCQNYLITMLKAFFFYQILNSPKIVIELILDHPLESSPNGPLKENPMCSEVEDDSNPNLESIRNQVI